MVSFEGTDVIKITNKTFSYNSFSTSKNYSLRSMGRFRLQQLLEHNTWSNRYNIPKNDRYSNLSTDWTLVSSNFTLENYGNILTYDQRDSAHADKCFSYITITHFVYRMDIINYFNDLFESIPDYRKIVILKVLNKNDVHSLNECGWIKKS